MIRLRYFASLREALGSEGEDLQLPDGVADVAGLLTLLRQRGDPWAEALAEGRPVLVAINQEMAGAAAVLQDGDEVGLFPPVTGG